MIGSRSHLSSTALIAVAILQLAILGCRGGDEGGVQPGPEETTRVHTGDAAPDLAVERLDGGTFRLADHRGEVVVISFFATWCPPCREELPVIERDLWTPLRDRGLVVIAVAREETVDVVRPFVEQGGFSFDFAVDPDRSNYARYADAYIPRLVVVGRDGTVLHHATEYRPEAFGQIVALVERALAEPA